MESSVPSESKHNPVVLKYLAAILLYLGSAGIGLEMALWQQFAPLIWPPAGLGLALVLLGGYRYLPVIFLGAALVRLFEGGACRTPFSSGLGTPFLPGSPG